MSASSDNEDLAVGDDDLFGSDDDAPKVRELSDQELDSGDDEQRDDRAPKSAEVEEEQDDGGEDCRIQEQTLERHPLPKPADGEWNVLRLPKFLGIDALPYSADTFKVPVVDHHETTRLAKFSASTTAATTMRYRENPATGEVESNTVVYKWSDGSSTISVGDQHFELQKKSLAPPRDKAYQEVQDSHQYVASPSMTASLLLLVGHMSNQFTVMPNKDIEDDAIKRLQRRLAEAKGGDVKDGPELIASNQDPELQKKRAEVAEKEKLRMDRRKEAAAEKASLGVGRRSGGGLNVDDLEDRGRRVPAGRRATGAKRKSRRGDYDDSEDDLPRGRNREDEYDKEDDFLASSDEEPEEGDGDEEEDEELEDDYERPKAKKQKTSKKAEESDIDAEADLEDDEAPTAAPIPTDAAAGRGRKRNVIEDDEDDE